MNQGFVGWSVAPRSSVSVISRVELAYAQSSIQINTLSEVDRDQLRITCQWRGDVASNFTTVTLQFNGDTGTNYDWNSIEWLAINAFSSQGAVNATALQIACMPGATSVASASGQCELVIPNYLGRVFHKTTISNANYRTGTTSSQIQGNRYSGYWRSAERITSLVLTPTTGNFVPGTVVQVLAV